LTSDPIGLAGGLNTFGYVYQNPARWFDRFGLDAFSDNPNVDSVTLQPPYGDAWRGDSYTGNDGYDIWTDYDICVACKDGTKRYFKTPGEGMFGDTLSPANDYMKKWREENQFQSEEVCPLK
jgi:hypothetical protein